MAEQVFSEQELGEVSPQPNKEERDFSQVPLAILQQMGSMEGVKGWLAGVPTATHPDAYGRVIGGSQRSKFPR
ncbi:MAG: hypothetical protein ACD_28C00252G0001 [uncultured bacterium]|nr:MAG: hypothetical protein ACD_28C00252G0001 [uncultured bacterium]